MNNRRIPSHRRNGRAEKDQSTLDRVIEKVNQCLEILVLIVKVALPAGQEVRDSGTEDGTHENPLESFLAVKHVAQYVADELGVFHVPVVRQLGRYVQYVVEFAELADQAVLGHGDVVVAQGRPHHSLAHVLPVQLLG